jgi:hypothetical protein
MLMFGQNWSVHTRFQNEDIYIRYVPVEAAAPSSVRPCIKHHEQSVLCIHPDSILVKLSSTNGFSQMSSCLGDRII